MTIVNQTQLTPSCFGYDKAALSAPSLVGELSVTLRDLPHTLFMAELTAASHDPQQYLAIATRLVKEEYGDDAVLDVAAANSCAVKISRAQPHPQAAKVSQAEQR